MFKSKNKKIMYTLVNPFFYYIKVGCKGVKLTRTCYPDVTRAASCENLSSGFLTRSGTNRAVKALEILDLESRGIVLFM